MITNKVRVQSCGRWDGRECASFVPPTLPRVVCAGHSQRAAEFTVTTLSHTPTHRTAHAQIPCHLHAPSISVRSHLKRATKECKATRGKVTAHGHTHRPLACARGTPPPSASRAPGTALRAPLTKTGRHGKRCKRQCPCSQACVPSGRGPC